MLEQSMDQMQTRQKRVARRPRRLAAIVLTIGLLSISVLAGVIGWSATQPESRTEIDVKANGGETSHGRIVVVGSSGCREIDFNNRTGRLHDNQEIPCPEIMPGGAYHYPSKRLEGISKGFSNK